MKIVLLADVKKVGRRGEIKDVANGYALNVLIPQHLALPGTPENIKQVEKKTEHLSEKKALDDALLVQHIKQVEGKSLHIKARSNEKGKLFQTIRAQNVAQALLDSFNVSIPETAIRADDIHAVGEYSASLSGGGETVTFSIVVS